MKRGFTLIEMLVVMLIIGIATSAIMMSSGHFYLNNKNGKGLANEMVVMLRLARDQAIFSMNTLSMKIEDERYAFYKLDDSKNTVEWKPLSGGFWKPRLIPAGVNVYIANPPIILYPSGEVVPFTVRISQENSQAVYTIKGNTNGSIIIDE